MKEIPVGTRVEILFFGKESAHTGKDFPSMKGVVARGPLIKSGMTKNMRAGHIQIDGWITIYSCSMRVRVIE